MNRKLTLAFELLAAAVLLSSHAGTALAQKGGKAAPYATIDLHPGGPYFESTAEGLNDRGLVVGYARRNGAVDAVYWMIDDAGVSGGVLNPGPATMAIARRVSTHGEITGSGNVQVLEDNVLVTRERGLFWPTPNANPLLLEPPPGYNRCWPLGMNNNGVVVGVAWIGPVSTAVAWQVQYDSDGPFVSDALDLGAWTGHSSAATAVSNFSDGIALVVGTDSGVNTDTAVYWGISLNDDGDISAVGPLDLNAGGSYSYATSVNDDGEVCGTVSDGTKLTGFVKSAGKFIPLPVLRRTLFERESVRDLNTRGEAVGHLSDSRSGDWIAVLWSGNSIQKLADLMGNSSFVAMKSANSINSHGDIVGWGWSDTQQAHAFIMIKKK